MLAAVGHPKGNKYHALSKQYCGVTYHSALEAGQAAELDLRVKAGELVRWERQNKIEMYVYGMKVATYFIDFVLYFPDGTREFLECKGLELPAWQLKWALFEALVAGWWRGEGHPDHAICRAMMDGQPVASCLGDRLRVVR